MYITYLCTCMMDNLFTLFTVYSILLLFKSKNFLFLVICNYVIANEYVSETVI